MKRSEGSWLRRHKNRQHSSLIRAETKSIGSPKNLSELNKQVYKGSISEWQRRQLRELLRKYESVFSKHSGDFDCNDQIVHTISVDKGTKPFWLPPHRLGLEKEALAKKQVKYLLEKGLIERADGT